MNRSVDHAAFLKENSPGGDPRALLELLQKETAIESLTTEGVADLVGAIAAAHSSAPMTDAQIYAVEALIHPEIRPLFDVVNDSYAAVGHPIWPRLNDSEVRARIETAIRASGRIELRTGARLYAGTGFVVGAGLLMTNRHVAELFSLGLGDREITFKPGFDPGFDLKRERGGAAGEWLAVKRARLIHPYWDCALLDVENLPESAGVLTLSGQSLADLVGRDVALVGYPAEDPRNPPDEQDDVMDGVYRVKRLAPGKLSGLAGAASFGNVVMALGHDASTLGGNSGSAVIDLDTGLVVGLHFGGAYRLRNTAAPAAELAADRRLHDAGVAFDVPRPTRDPAWSDAWRRAFAAEAPEPRPPRGAPTVVANRTAAVTSQSPSVRIEPDGAVTLTVPVEIKVRLGGGASISSSGSAGGPTTEAMVEPWRETFANRRGGYAADFLDEGGTRLVPPPIPADPGVLARTTAGADHLDYQNFSVAMHAKRRLALFTASNVTGEKRLRRPEENRAYSRTALSGLGPNDQEQWFLDERMDATFQVPDYFYTRDGGNFDKGHIVRRDDVAWGETYDALRRANGDTYHVTNCSPQLAGFNRSNKGEDNWGDFENVVLSQAATERLCVFAGPVLDAADPWFPGKAAPRQPMLLQIPSRFWKVVVARAEDGLAVYALLLEQNLGVMPRAEPEEGREFVLPEEFEKSLVRLKDIEGWTGLTFDAGLHKVDQYFSERGVAAATIAGARRQRRKKKI